MFFRAFVLLVMPFSYGLADGLPQTDLLAKARKLYAESRYEQAIAVYEKIPETNERYLISREELAWAYLMNDNFSASLGLAQDLLKPGVPIASRLESRFLVGYAYLKTCHFEQVKNQIMLYQKDLLNLKSQMSLAQKKKSWNLAYSPEVVATLKKQKSPDFNRTATNYQKLVDESLLKVQFLRFELLSLQQQLENKKVKRSDISMTDENSKKSKLAQVSFATDAKEVWPDEVFKAETSVNNLCGVKL